MFKSINNGRIALSIRDGIKTARAHLSLGHVALIAAMTFLLGLGIGATV